MDNKYLQAKIAEMTNGKGYARVEHRDFVEQMLKTKYANSLHERYPQTPKLARPAVRVQTKDDVASVIRATSMPLDFFNPSGVGTGWLVYPKAYGSIGAAEVADAAQTVAAEAEQKVTGQPPHDPYNDD